MDADGKRKSPWLYILPILGCCYCGLALHICPACGVLIQMCVNMTRKEQIKGRQGGNTGGGAAVSRSGESQQQHCWTAEHCEDLSVMFCGEVGWKYEAPKWEDPREILHPESEALMTTSVTIEQPPELEMGLEPVPGQKEGEAGGEEAQEALPPPSVDVDRSPLPGQS